jgi:hypothetical protein
MAGIAGALIGLTSGAQPPIAAAQALVDAGTVGRGCTTNFIGFGLGATSQEPLPEDFNVTDDTVALAITAGASYNPTYTAIAGNTVDKTLSWAEVVAP